VTGKAAVFLDRDGTIIEDPGYLAEPGDVRLLPGAAQAIVRLNRAGRPAVVVTNQSGIARGLLTKEQYFATEQRLDALLQERGARLDAHYYCPHHPDLTGQCTCRKPGVQLFVRAAEDFGLDLEASWWVGDRIRDVLPAETVGGRGLLVLTGDGVKEATTPEARRFRIVPDLSAAVELILAAPLPFPAS
jgi:D-glycero-D-manno-heptose 1,7-bisphosphate phosphatase